MSSPAYALCREIRARSGLSQRALAAAADVSPSTVARIETGRLEPTLDLLLRLVDAAGLDLRLVLTPGPSAEATDAAMAQALTLEQRFEQLGNVSEFALEAARARARAPTGD